MSRARRGGILLYLAVCGFHSPLLSAAEWAAEPYFDTSLFYNDNIQLTTQQQESVQGITLTPKIILGRRTETSKMVLTTRLDFTRFKDNKALDSDDQIVRLDSQYQTERTQWRFDADMTRDSTRTSELEGSGRVQTARRREKLELRPSWAHLFGEKTTLQLSYQFTDVSYRALASEFVDYRYQVINSALRYALSERNQAELSLYGSRYEVPDSNDLEIDSYGIQAGLTHQFTETIEGTLKAGARRTKETTHYQIFGFDFEQVDRGSGQLYSASLKKDLERSSFLIELQRQLSPSGVGALYQSDSITLHMDQKLTDLLSFTLALRGIRNKAIGTGSSSTDRKYYNIQPAIHWHLTRNWRLNASYAYIRQKYDIFSEAADSNKLMATLVYKWPKMAASR